MALMIQSFSEKFMGYHMKNLFLLSTFLIMLSNYACTSLQKSGSFSSQQILDSNRNESILEKSSFEKRDSHIKYLQEKDSQLKPKLSPMPKYNYSNDNYSNDYKNENKDFLRYQEFVKKYNL